eukprot:760251-Hanusia_phi.AAC.3
MTIKVDMKEVLTIIPSLLPDKVDYSDVRLGDIDNRQWIRDCDQKITIKYDAGTEILGLGFPLGLQLAAAALSRSPVTVTMSQSDRDPGRREADAPSRGDSAAWPARLNDRRTQSRSPGFHGGPPLRPAPARCQAATPGRPPVMGPRRPASQQCHGARALRQAARTPAAPAPRVPGTVAPGRVGLPQATEAPGRDGATRMPHRLSRGQAESPDWAMIPESGRAARRFYRTVR